MKPRKKKDGVQADEVTVHFQPRLSISRLRAYDLQRVDFLSPEEAERAATQLIEAASKWRNAR